MVAAAHRHLLRRNSAETRATSGAKKILIAAAVLLVAGVCAIALTGCSTGSRYEAEGGMWKLGYSETQLAPNAWRVNYRGYDITQARANDFALLRGAELCLAAGFSHFKVAGESVSDRPGAGMVLPAGNAAVYASGNYTEASVSIQCSSDAGDAYDAAFLRASLRKKYKLPV